MTGRSILFGLAAGLLAAQWLAPWPAFLVSVLAGLLSFGGAGGS